MNDKAISLLEQYDMQVEHTWKGRGAILCETNRGLLILKEYIGPVAKAPFLYQFLTMVREQGDQGTEQLIQDKEGKVITYDAYKTPYILKTYVEGRECNPKDAQDCEAAVKRLAKYHNASDMREYESRFGVPVGASLPSANVLNEYEKHNKELKRVRRFLREKSQKNDFEVFLLGQYDYFYEQALQVTEELRYYEEIMSNCERTVVCHGDYQHHNILITEQGMFLCNFEKCCLDDPMRDLYLFLRKLLEKSDWSVTFGTKLFCTYDKVRQLSALDQIQLHYRFAYPEKFWKIVNHYYNNGKAWIPGKNMEKIQRLCEQEPSKQIFLEQALGIQRF